MTEQEIIQRAKDALNELCDTAEESGVDSTEVDELKVIVRRAFREEV
jgi:hypothetical protein